MLSKISCQYGQHDQGKFRERIINVLVFCHNVLIITPMDEGTLIHHHFLAACLVTRLRQPIKIDKLSAASLETTQSPLMDDIR